MPLYKMPPLCEEHHSLIALEAIKPFFINFVVAQNFLVLCHQYFKKYTIYTL